MSNDRPDGDIHEQRERREQHTSAPGAEPTDSLNVDKNAEPAAINGSKHPEASRLHVSYGRSSELCSNLFSARGRVLRVLTLYAAAAPNAPARTVEYRIVTVGRTVAGSTGCLKRYGRGTGLQRGTCTDSEAGRDHPADVPARDGSS